MRGVWHRQEHRRNKAKQISDLLNVNRFDHTWLLPSRMESASYIWTIMVDGLMVDARRMPREIQEIAYEKGYIPYIPADR